MATLQEVTEKLSLGLSPEANIFPPDTQGYADSTNAYYWGSSKQNPLVVFQPATANDVKQFFTVIKAYPKLVFAVKGAGHIAHPGFSSTTGILVDMALFKKVHYHEETQTVDLGPGMKWDDVYPILNPYGRTVAGASSCRGVGVPGFNLGGGYSNKTNQFGLAIDSIRAIEVVLPTGIILPVSESSDKELFWALKGGGNNFGIVTNWNMITHPQGPIYSVTFKYARSEWQQLMNAIVKYSQNVDPLSNVEAVFEWTIENKELQVLAVVELFYDGAKPPKELFEEFVNIPHTQDTPVFENWQDRLAALPGHRQSYRMGWGSEEDDLKTFRGRFSCVMLSKYNKLLIEETITLFTGLSAEFKAHGGQQMYADVWPFSPNLFDNSTDSAWPHAKGSPNMPLVLNFKWHGEEHDAFWLGKIKTATTVLQQSAIKLGCAKADAPIYYNLADDNVTAAEIYRDHMPKLSTLRHTYDPDRIMNRTGGFRIQ